MNFTVVSSPCEKFNFNRLKMLENAEGVGFPCFALENMDSAVCDAEERGAEVAGVQEGRPVVPEDGELEEVTEAALAKLKLFFSLSELSTPQG